MRKWHVQAADDALRALPPDADALPALPLALLPTDLGVDDDCTPFFKQMVSCAQA